MLINLDYTSMLTNWNWLSFNLDQLKFCWPKGIDDLAFILDQLNFDQQDLSLNLSLLGFSFLQDQQWLSFNQDFLRFSFNQDHLKLILLQSKPTGICFQSRPTRIVYFSIYWDYLSMLTMTNWDYLSMLTNLDYLSVSTLTK